MKIELWIVVVAWKDGTIAYEGTRFESEAEFVAANIRSGYPDAIVGIHKITQEVKEDV